MPDTFAQSPPRHVPASMALLCLVGPVAMPHAQVEAWVATYQTPYAGLDAATALHIDRAGDVHVTGNSFGPLDQDIVTIKYDRQGRCLWTARYDSGGHDEARAVACDGAGNTCVTGSATLSYDRSGTLVWVDATFFGVDLAIDHAGGTYVVGTGQGSFTTVKYDVRGAPSWVARYSGPHGAATALRMALDTAGNAYVTGTSLVGYSGSGRDFDFTTVKYDRGGQQLWVATYDLQGQRDQAHAIAVDRAGNVYVAGRCFTTPIGANSRAESVVVQYDRHGVQRWVSASGGYEDVDVTVDVALDDAGSLYTVGYTVDGGWNYEPELVTTKFSTANGSVVWSALGPECSLLDTGNYLAVDDAGDALVTTRDELIHYGGSGAMLWRASGHAINALAVDGDGNAHLAGHAAASQGTTVYEVVQYQPCGFQPYGVGTRGSGGLTPQLSGSGPATRGSTVTLDITGGLGGAVGGILVGVGFQSQTLLPVAGGTVLVQPTVVHPVGLGGAIGAPGAGSLSSPLLVPSTPSVLGVNMNFQVGLVDSGAPAGVSMTNAVAIWIG